MEGRALLRLLGQVPNRPGVDMDEVSLLGEEMIEWGLDPKVVSEEAFLKARDQFIQGRIEIEEVIPLVLRYQEEYDARDLAIGLSLSQGRLS